ncbi:MAG TPA: hypothetical protein VND95_12210, partial [Stellaceae bacterium]|nr:hypothetical protein [Stellaceae bacterium]
AATVVLCVSPAVALAQQAGVPIPLYPGSVPSPFAQQALPAEAPVPQGPPTAPPPEPSPPEASPPAPSPPAASRVFCQQPVTLQLAHRDAVAPRYRRFVGMWSDASWTPQLCAALIVENVTPDGTASIVYVYGPMGPSERGPGGVLNGTGIIRDGELRFQNSDGSQFAFRPLYADLHGHLTTPTGGSYEAVFKKTL